MKISVTNAVQGAIGVLSAALLVAAAHAQGSPAPPAEGLTAVALAEHAAQPAPASEHRIRVGVAPVGAQMNARAAAAGLNFGEPLRVLLISQLAGPVEVMPLRSAGPDRVELDAKALECDYVLYTTVIRHPKAGARLGFVRGASEMSQTIPMTGTGRSMGPATAAATTRSALSAAGEATRVVRANDEVSLEYRLIAAPDGLPLLSAALHARATDDGQDVIAPLIEKEALAVLDAIRHRAAGRQ